MQQKWYEKNLWVIVFLIIFWPVGLFLMWKYKPEWKMWVKVLITILILLVLVNNIMSLMTQLSMLQSMGFIL